MKSPDFRKILDGLAVSKNSFDVFRSFVRLAACVVAAQTREREYLEEAGRWSRAELDQFSAALGALVLEMESEPFTDVLGPVYMDLMGKTAQDRRGTFHTPPAICKLMAQMVAGPVPETGPITMCEPCCGSGAMILAFAESLPRPELHRLRVTAIDVDPVACDMCFINTTLWGVPCVVIQGNSLSLELRAQWRNVHHLMPFLRFVVGNSGDASEAVTSEAVASIFSGETVAAASREQGTPPGPELVQQLRVQLDFTHLLDDRAA